MTTIDAFGFFTVRTDDMVMVVFFAFFVELLTVNIDDRVYEIEFFQGFQRSIDRDFVEFG